MIKQRNDLKVLLLQIREDKETMLEEFYEFIQYSGLKEEQLDVLNTYQTPFFSSDILQQYDALFVGGSSDASVLKPQEFIFVDHCKQLLKEAYERNMPVFASCFGFQIAVEALGGKVIVDSEHMEMGIYELKLTNEAQNDPLLFDVPTIFYGVSGHRERASILPPNSTLLGYSDLCPYHIVRFGNKPFYGFQFHPEVDRKDLIVRIKRYQTRYMRDDAALQKVIDSAVNDTPHANDLLRLFIDRIVLQHAAQAVTQYVA